MTLLLDITPLRTHPAYARLYAGFSLSNIGSQMSTVAIGLQVYAITGDTAAVGLVGFFALAPLLVLGLYGGSLVDHYDRRKVALVAQLVAWAASLLALAQSLAGNTHVGVLYAIVMIWNAGYAVSSPARQSIYPRILPPELLPAANALGIAAMTTAMTVGPLLAGFLVDLSGFTVTYLVDAVITTAAIAGILQLHPIPPEDHPERTTGRPGLASVIDGMRFLATRPNVRMTFVADIVAMVLAQPRVLFPAAGAVILGGGARTVGYLAAAAAVGGIVAMVFSGPVGRINRQGLAVYASIMGWGAGIAGFGLALLAPTWGMPREAALWLAMAGVGAAGACDSVSAVFRTTILQSATPDHLRGRLQGIFIVVVAGGPRLGEMLGGAAAARVGEGWTAVVGGVLCMGVIAVMMRTQHGFTHYDARRPTP